MVGKRRVPCPVCDQPVDLADAQASKFLPFCSERCRTIDLGRWYNEGYSVPVKTRRLLDELLGDADKSPEEEGS